MADMYQIKLKTATSYSSLVERIVKQPDKDIVVDLRAVPDEFRIVQSDRSRVLGIIQYVLNQASDKWLPENAEGFAC